jgi:hypothetical protein
VATLFESQPETMKRLLTMRVPAQRIDLNGADCR